MLSLFIIGKKELKEVKKRFFPSAEQYSIKDVLDNIFEDDMNFTHFDWVKYSFLVHLGLKPMSPEDEKFSIQILFNGKNDLSQIIKSSLVKEEQFVIIPKTFWEDWMTYVGFKDGHMLTNFKP